MSPSSSIIQDSISRVFNSDHGYVKGLEFGVTIEGVYDNLER